MSSHRTAKTEDVKADLVIIGGGGAGIPAAIAAVEAGANNIIVLEKRRIPGGNAVFPVGIFAAESQIQKRQGINARTDEVFKIAMKYAHWKIDPKLVRALVDKSGDTIHWLESKGVKFGGVILHYPNQVPAVFHIVSPPGRTGAAIIKALRKNCTDLGVRLLCQTEAKRLLTDKKGSVIGVLATTKDKELSIQAKSVIIATGGFAGNKELLKKYIPFYDEEEIKQPVGIGHKGDGLRMTTEIGAATEDTTVLEMGGPRFTGPVSISPFVSRPNTLWVNRNGERFTDETVGFLFSEGANTVNRQPGKTSYTLFDEKIRQSIIEEGLDPLEQITMGNKSWPAGLDEDLRSQVDKGMVKISDSWDEIAEWIGAAPEVLKATIDEYNFFCDQGNDEIFAKDRGYLRPLRTPSYYAIKCGIHFTTTHGGIKVNHRMEVLNQQDIPIRGLYAAGVDIGGTDADTYNLILSGHSFGFTVNSGRIAGENAARYALELNRQLK